MIAGEGQPGSSTTQRRQHSSEDRHGSLRICVVGSGTYYLSGISYYTTYLASALSCHVEVSTLLMRKLVPRRFYPGRARVGHRLTSLSTSTLLPTFDGVDWYLLPSLLGAVRFLRRHDPEVLVLQWWTAAVLSQYLLLSWWARRRGVPIVIELHEDQDSGEQRIPLVARIGRWGLRRLAASSSVFVVHSEWDRSRLSERFHLPISRVHVVPHGPYEVRADLEGTRQVSAPGPGPVRASSARATSTVPLASMAEHDLAGKTSTDRSPVDRVATVSGPATQMGSYGWEPGADLTPIRLLFFGVIRPYKGLEDLVDAFSLLPRDSGKAWRLTIVGETWEDWTLPLEKLRDSAYRREVEVVNRYVADDEAAAAFEEADIVVLPYHRSSASGPLHMAMGAGLPTVVTKVGGLVEAVHDYSGAVLVDPGNPAALAEGIVEATALMGLPHVRPLTWEQIGDLYSRILYQVKEESAVGAPRMVPGAPRQLDDVVNGQVRLREGAEAP